MTAVFKEYETGERSADCNHSLCMKCLNSCRKQQYLEWNADISIIRLQATKLKGMGSPAYLKSETWTTKRYKWHENLAKEIHGGTVGHFAFVRFLIVRKCGNPAALPTAK